MLAATPGAKTNGTKYRGLVQQSILQLRNLLLLHETYFKTSIVLKALS